MKSFSAFAITAVILVALALGLNNESPRASLEPTVEPPLALEPAAPAQPAPKSVTRGADQKVEIGEALHFQTALSHGAVGEASFDEIYAEIRVQAGEVLPEMRPPLNVALVIDRSGSMRGQPMEQARQAALTFVDSLEEQDRVAIISFDHHSRVDLSSTFASAEGKRQLRSAISSIREGGATNISDGVLQGFEQVLANREADTVDRVILMTDGIPNRGVTSPQGLADKSRSLRSAGVTVSTLGFGFYDSSMMVDMAREGAGNFRHIRNVEDMELAFAAELEDLRNTVASGVQVDLNPAAGVQILDVYGFSQEDIRNSGKRIVIGDMHAEARRSVIVRLRVDRGVVGSTQDVLNIEAQYVDRVMERPTHLAFDLDVERVDSEARVTASINTSVLARVEEIRAQESVREVMNLYASGRREAAEQRLEVERRRSVQARQRYQIPEEGEESRRVQNTLDRVGEGIRNFAPSSALGRNFQAAENEVSSISIQGR